MCELEADLGTRSFFVMDENFLLQRPRALDLLARMKAGNKAWALYVFSSANALAKYQMRELVELGISWVWMGLESPRAGYAKLRGHDTLALTRELRYHGIKVLGSTIIGLEHHTPDNLGAEIAHAVTHATDFHQFMLYTPVPGTPLYREMEEAGRLLAGDLADIHGQYQFNFRHASISPEQSRRFLDAAFQLDFERNGPSLYRLCRTALAGWRRYRSDPDARVRARFAWEVRNLRHAGGALLWAMERELRQGNPRISRRIRALRREWSREFGWGAQLSTPLLGAVLAWTSRREQRRLVAGKTYEPRTFVERHNWMPEKNGPPRPVATQA